MASSTIAVSVTRDDQGRPLLELATTTETVGTLVAPAKTVAKATGSSETELWTSPQHGVSGTRTRPFERLIIAVDPEHTVVRDDDDPQCVYVKLYRTPQAGGSATAYTELIPVEIGHCLILSSPIAGTSAPGNAYVTKAGSFNPDADADIPVYVIQE